MTKIAVNGRPPEQAAAPGLLELERQAARVKARLMHGMKDDGLGD